MALCFLVAATRRWYPSFGTHRTVHIPLYERGAFSVDERTEQNEAMNFLSLQMRCWVRIRPHRLTWSWIVTGMLRRVGIRKFADFEQCTTMLSVRRHQEKVAGSHHGQSDRLAQQRPHRSSVRSYFLSLTTWVYNYRTLKFDPDGAVFAEGHIAQPLPLSCGDREVHPLPVADAIHHIPAGGRLSFPQASLARLV